MPSLYASLYCGNDDDRNTPPGQTAMYSLWVPQWLVQPADGEGHPCGKPSALCSCPVYWLIFSPNFKGWSIKCIFWLFPHLSVVDNITSHFSGPGGLQHPGTFWAMLSQASGKASHTNSRMAVEVGAGRPNPRSSCWWDSDTGWRYASRFPWYVIVKNVFQLRL